MRKIELENRYGHNYWLEEYGENTYILKTDEEYEWPIYINGTIDNIVSVDWDGAYPIGLGSVIEGKQVIEIKAIREGFIFKVDNIKNNY